MHKAQQVRGGGGGGCFNLRRGCERTFQLVVVLLADVDYTRCIPRGVGRSRQPPIGRDAESLQAAMHVRPH